MEPTRSRRTALALALLAAGAAGCKSGEPAPELDPLPFHVAVVPLTSGIVREPAGALEHATEMRLAPDLARLNEALRDALGQRAFTQVTLLEPPEEDAAGALTPEERDRHWVERATEAGADLVLLCELDLVPVVRQEANGNAWLDIPLFLLGGPFVWFVEDRTYSVDVDLRGAFYDRWALDAERRRLGNPLARLSESSASFEGVDLNFFARADNAGQYLISILIPSFFLAKQNDEIAEELSREVVERLGNGLASSTLRKGSELVRSDVTAPFHLVPEETTVRREGERLVLRGTVLLRQDARVDLAGWRLRTGEGAFEGDFDGIEPEPRGERWLAWPLECSAPAGAADARVALELRAGSRDPITRSYTLAVRAPPAGGAERSAP